MASEQRPFCGSSFARVPQRDTDGYGDDEPAHNGREQWLSDAIHRGFRYGSSSAPYQANHLRTNSSSTLSDSTLVDDDYLALPIQQLDEVDLAEGRYAEVIVHDGPEVVVNSVTTPYSHSNITHEGLQVRIESHPLALSPGGLYVDDRIQDNGYQGPGETIEKPHPDSRSVYDYKPVPLRLRFILIVFGGLVISLVLSELILHLLPNASDMDRNIPNILRNISEIHNSSALNDTTATLNRRFIQLRDSIPTGSSARLEPAAETGTAVAVDPGNVGDSFTRANSNTATKSEAPSSSSVQSSVTGSGESSPASQNEQTSMTQGTTGVILPETGPSKTTTLSLTDNHDQLQPSTTIHATTNPTSSFHEIVSSTHIQPAETLTPDSSRFSETAPPQDTATLPQQQTTTKTHDTTASPDETNTATVPENIATLQHTTTASPDTATLPEDTGTATSPLRTIPESRPAPPEETGTATLPLNSATEPLAILPVDSITSVLIPQHTHTTTEPLLTISLPYITTTDLHLSLPEDTHTATPPQTTTSQPHVVLPIDTDTAIITPQNVTTEPHLTIALPGYTTTGPLISLPEHTDTVPPPQNTTEPPTTTTALHSSYPEDPLTVILPHYTTTEPHTPIPEDTDAAMLPYNTTAALQNTATSLEGIVTALLGATGFSESITASLPNTAHSPQNAATSVPGATLVQSSAALALESSDGITPSGPPPTTQNTPLPSSNPESTLQLPGDNLSGLDFTTSPGTPSQPQSTLAGVSDALAKVTGAEYPVDNLSTFTQIPPKSDLSSLKYQKPFTTLTFTGDTEAPSLLQTIAFTASSISSGSYVQVAVTTTLLAHIKAAEPLTEITTTATYGNGTVSTISKQVYDMVMSTVEYDSAGKPTTKYVHVLQSAQATTLRDSLGYPTATVDYYELNSTTTLFDGNGVATATVTTNVPETGSPTTLYNGDGVPYATVILMRPIATDGLVGTPTPTASPPSNGPHILKLKHMAGAMYVVGLMVPTLVAILVSIPIRILSRTVNMYQGFHVLASDRGARGAESLFLATTGLASIPNGLLPLHSGHYLLGLTNVLTILSAIIIPFSAEALRPMLKGPQCRDGVERLQCSVALGVSVVPTQVISALLMALLVGIITAALLLRRWKTGVERDPWNMADMAQLAAGSDMRNFLRRLQRYLESKNTSYNGGFVDKMRRNVFGLREWVENGTTKYSVLILNHEVDDPVEKPGNKAGRSVAFADLKNNRRRQRYRWPTGTSSPFYMLSHAGRIMFLLLLAGVLAAVIIYSVLPRAPEDQGWLTENVVGERFFFSSAGVIITFAWGSFFHTVAISSPYKLLHRRRPNRGQAIHINPATNPFTGFWIAFVSSRRNIYLGVVAGTAILSELLPLFLGNIPHSGLRVESLESFCVYISAGILVIMILVLGSSFFIEHQPNLGIDPTTILGAMYAARVSVGQALKKKASPSLFV